MINVSKSRFKRDFFKFCREVEQTGEELIITDHGCPVLKVIPYVEDPEEYFRGLRNTVLKFDEPMGPVGNIGVS